MEKIIFKTDRGISIITPTGKTEDCMKDIPEGAEYKIIDDSELPQTREFRGAWDYDLKEDIPKSKEIHKNNLRAKRKALLEKLDVDWIRAVEENRQEDASSVVVEKQRLRDITNDVDKAKTIAGIKKVKL